MITFNTDGMIRQSFPFPKPIMDYILENLQPQHLVKLYPTCKSFYAKYGQHIIQHLEIVDDGEPEFFDLSKTVIRSSNPALPKLKDFWISDSFTHRASNFLLQLPEFSRLTIKKLELCESICWEDYEIFTKPETIQELKTAADVIFFKSDGHHYSPSTFENIIAQIPNAKSIEISDVYFSPTTCESLLFLNHNVKFTNFVLKDVDGIWNFNIDLFTDFVLKNAAPDCNFHLDFFSYGFDDYEIEIEKECAAKIKSALEKKKIRDSNIS